MNSVDPRYMSIDLELKVNVFVLADCLFAQLAGGVIALASSQSHVRVSSG